MWKRSLRDDGLAVLKQERRKPKRALKAQLWVTDCWVRLRYEYEMQQCEASQSY